MFIDAQKVITKVEKQKCVVQCQQCFVMIKHDDILQSVKRALNIAELKFPLFCHDIGVKKRLTDMLQNEIFSMCHIHCSAVQNALADITATQFLLEWCKFINDIFAGKREECEGNVIYDMAKSMHMKQTRKKNVPH